jgi:hypothetical protein
MAIGGFPSFAEDIKVISLLHIAPDGIKFSQ